MKFSLMTYSLVSKMRSGEMKLEDVIAFAENEGFDAIELLMFDFSRPTGEIKTMLENHQMKISCINAFVDLAVQQEDTHSDNIALCQQIIDKAVELSAPMVMLVPAIPQFIASEEDKQKGLPRIISALQKITPYAESKGVVLTIENYPALQTPFCSVAEVTNILDQVPGLKLTFDYGNMLVAGEDPLKAYEMLKKIHGECPFKRLAVRNRGNGDPVCRWEIFKISGSWPRGNGLFVAIYQNGIRWL